MKKKMPGTVCITNKNNGSVYWYARINGKQVYFGKDAEGKELAEAARGKFIARKYEQKAIAGGLKPKKSELKIFRELIDWYMQLPSIQKQSCYKGKVCYSAHLLKYFKDTPLYSIEVDDQERYRVLRREKGAAHGTINLEIALMSHAYNLAVERKKISPDFLPGKSVLEHCRNPRPIVSDEQFAKLIKHADPDFADVLVCGYESAMRSNEICNLRAYQIHLDTVISEVPRVEANYIDLGIFDTKNGARRTVPVSPELKGVLKRRLQGLESEERVFTRTRQKQISPWNPTLISSKMRYLCKAAGLPHGDKTLNKKGERIGLVFHCLRHTRTTKWVEMGFSDEIIRRATGHKSLEAYQQYIKLDPSAVMRLVEARTNEIPSVMTGI